MPTILLPVRSSLYVCFPSVGIALAGAAVGKAAWRVLPDGRRRTVLTAGILLPFLLWPVYHARNGRLRSEAVLSTTALEDLARAVEAGGDTVRSVVLLDAPQVRPSLRDSFGTLVQEATDLVLARPIQVRLEPLAEREEPTDAMVRGADLVLRLTDGRLMVVHPEQR